MEKTHASNDLQKAILTEKRVLEALTQTDKVVDALDKSIVLNFDKFKECLRQRYLSCTYLFGSVPPNPA